jgi:hypothetical protein
MWKNTGMITRIHRGLDYSGLASLVPVFFLGVLLSGCGVKTYPKPILLEQLPQIQDLKTQVRLKAVELTWSVPEQLTLAMKDAGYSFVILRSELIWGNRSCLDCPVSGQAELITIDPASPAPAVREGNLFTWMDTNVSTQHAYRYEILIRDRKQHPLSSSNVSTAKVLAPPPPIKSLSAAPEPRGVALQWKATAAKTIQGQVSPGEVLFLLERHGPDGTWERLSALPVKGTTFLDSAVASGQAYDYRVTPVYLFEDTLILGEPSVFLQARAPDAVPPPPPGNVWVIPVKGALEVHWLPSEGKVEGYHVYRREGKEIIRLTATPLKNPPFVDSTVKKNSVYAYAVSAQGNQAGKREGLLSKWVEIRSLMIDQ